MDWPPLPQTVEGNEFHVVRQWLLGEYDYQQQKFTHEENDKSTREEGARIGGYWDQQFNTYLGRMEVLGLDTELGKQAAFKFLATVHGFVESVVRVYGLPPAPGVSSGNRSAINQEPEEPSS